MYHKDINIKPITWLMLILLAFTQTSCYNIDLYKISPSDYETVQDLSEQEKQPYNIVFAHVGDKIYQLVQVSYSQADETVKGILIRTEKDAMAIYDHVKKDGSITGSKGLNEYKLNQIHFFVDEVIKSENDIITFHRSNIQTTQIVKKAKGASAAANTGLVLGTIVVGFALFLLVACGCPHVYTAHGSQLLKASNTIVGAVSKNLEKDDFVMVESHQENSINIKIVNEEINETQFINHSILHQIIHDDGTQIIPGIDNKLYQIKKITSSKYVKTNGVQAKGDNLSYDFHELSRESDLSELHLKFPINTNSEKVNLILSVKNTQWSSHVIREWYKLFGTEISKHQEKMAKRRKEDLLNIRKEQGISLSVYTKENDKWVYQSSVDVVGSGIYKDIVVPLKKPTVQNDELEIKLVSGFKLWDVDFIALDTSAKEVQNTYVISPSKTDMNSESVARIESIDRDYEVLKEGDTLNLSYDLKPIPEGKIQSTVLNVSGYYQMNIEQEGDIQKNALISFRKEAQMSRFSFKLFQSFANSISLL